MEDLLKCPFCGGEAKVIRRWFKSGWIVPYIECTKCLATMGNGEMYITSERGKCYFENTADAVAAWNRRYADETNSDNKSNRQG